MKKYFYLATALVALAACSSNDFFGDQEALNTAGQTPIGFSSGTPAFTRADKTGSDAAADLNNHFYVYGIKKESADGAGNVQAGNLVYNNYAVNWIANSAMTTTSNTEGWEYVGYTLTDKEQAKITVNSGNVAQTIKYWDWGAADYTFYAFSAKPEDISGDKITVAKVQDQTTGAGKTVYDNGYTVTLAADASLDDLYFSERVNIVGSEGSNATNTNRRADNTYGGNVTFRFHNMASKVRVAMYETIPGYKVTLNSFKVVNSASPTFATMTTAETGAFKANFVNNVQGTAGSMTVKYVASGATQNHPTVAFTPDAAAANILTLGDQLKANVTIGTSATGATYDRTDGPDDGTEPDYTSVFSKEDNTQNLKLKVCYTLTAVDNSGNPTTGETITVTDATAEVPANYLQWKPGYAYTYLFKISDNTNGQTGTGTTPAGLYPITFDAVEMINADGLAEYITTVSEPSITTFGAIYNTTSTKYTAYQTGKNEYQAQTSPNQLDIFVTFMEGSSVMDPTVGTSGAQHVNVFKVTTTNATLYPITEASVAEAIAEPAMSVDIYTRSGEPGSYTYAKVTNATTITAGTTYYKADGESRDPGADGYVSTTAVAGTDYKVGAHLNVTNVTADGSTNFSSAPAKVTTVPAEDGTTKTVNALKLTGVKAGTYAVEYEASAAWTGTYKKVYKVIVVQ